jgi:uncharacterized membrane protein (UPF0136 family)
MRGRRNSELGHHGKLRQACNMQFENYVFWGYIVLLLIGGLIGFFKAGSKVSLITSAVAAAILIVTRIGVLNASFARDLANITMIVLLVVFAFRLTKTKKFMPNGMSLVLTLAVIIMLNFHRNNW